MASRLVSRRSLGGDTKPVPPSDEESKKKRKPSKKPRKSAPRRVSGKQMKMIRDMGSSGY